MDFVTGIWVVLAIGTAGYYLVEYKKAGHSGCKGSSEFEDDCYEGGLLVPEDDLEDVLGIRRKDVKPFLEQNDNRLIVHTFNNKDYYSIENLKQVLNTKPASGE